MCESKKLPEGAVKGALVGPMTARKSHKGHLTLQSKYIQYSTFTFMPNIILYLYLYLDFTPTALSYVHEMTLDIRETGNNAQVLPFPDAAVTYCTYAYVYRSIVELLIVCRVKWEQRRYREWPTQSDIRQMQMRSVVQPRVKLSTLGASITDWDTSSFVRLPNQCFRPPSTSTTLLPLKLYPICYPS
ncbi:hypothetical protein KQX54_008377 [Cotesia glomerata]|uniref:Uncharacterized protein n=1 Tax=Cotesia glomerata TaxID=32391 RepID=A0AAV7IJZ2_COTGL|nr:hypothetical protein KQX54_008377 [Cotesia glomerata]